MKFLRGVIGYALAALYAMTVWGEFAGAYGVAGGWIVALAIIGPLWFVNHYIGLIPQDSDAAFVDMGLGIAIGCLFRDIFSGGGVDSFIASLPTIGVIIVGAAIGGFTATKIQQHMDKGESK